MRDSLSEEIHMALLPYTLLYIADVPSALVAQPSSAVGFILYVRPTAAKTAFSLEFSAFFPCLPSLRHCKVTTFFFDTKCGVVIVVETFFFFL